MSSIAQAVWAVGGVLEIWDFGPSSHCNSSLSVPFPPLPTQYEKYLSDEIAVARKKNIPDTRVHVVLYFVAPTGHHLKPLDIEFMRRLDKICNVVPVIAKADTLTLDERREFRVRLQQGE